MPDGSAFVVSTAASIDPCAPRRVGAGRCSSMPRKGPLGPAAIAPDGSWIVVPVGQRRRRAGRDVASRRTRLHRPPGRQRRERTRRVRVAERRSCRRGHRVDAPIRSSRSSAIWDVASGTLTGTIPLVDSGAAVAVGLRARRPRTRRRRAGDDAVEPIGRAAADDRCRRPRRRCSRCSPSVSGEAS